MSTPINILFLEDRPDDAELLLFELEQAGLTVNWQRVDTRDEYVTCLTSDVDLILADYHLLDFEAPEALRLLQNKNLDIPFIVVTGALSEETAVACMRQGAADYLLKDRTARLGEAVKQALEQKALRQEQQQTQQALRQSEARYRRIFDAAPVSIWELDFSEIKLVLDDLQLQGLKDIRAHLAGHPNFAIECLQSIKILDVNNASLKIFQAGDKAELIEAFESLFRPETILFFQELLAAVFEEKPYMGGEVVSQTVQGQKINLMMQMAIPSKKSDFGHVVVVLQDITESKQAKHDILRLYEAERSRYHEAEALRQAALSLTTTIDLTEVIERILAELQNVVPYDSASVQLLQDNQIKVIGGRGFSNLPEVLGLIYPIQQDMPNIRVLETRRPLIINNVDQSPYAPAFRRELHAATNIYSWMGVPLLIGNEAIGMLTLDKEQIDFYTEAQARIAMAYAAQAAIAIENARLHTETEQRARQLAVLHELDQAISASLNISDVYQAFAYHTKRLLSFDRLSITLIDGDNLQVAYKAGPIGPPAGATFPLKDTAAFRAISQAQPVLRSNINANTGFTEDESLTASGLQSTMVIPLKIKRRVIGTFNLGSRQLSAYGPNDLEIAQAMADQLVLAIENAQLYKQAQQEISERKQAQQALEAERASLAERIQERTAELQRANAELARASRLKDEFLASMSHELRTPLNAILGLSEALQEEVYGPLTGKQFKSLGTIEQSGRHLLSLINDILDLSKIGAGKVTLDLGSVSVTTVCQASLQFVKQPAHKKGIELTATYDQDVTTLQADERRLKQVLVNLLSNAVKFTPKGGQIGLEVRGDLIQEVVQLTIWDTGIGIAETDMVNLFQPFVQLDSRLSREYAGTGLGLSLVYRLTEMHGGSVAVESQVGLGSRFTISLPWPNTPLKETDKTENSQSAYLEMSEHQPNSAGRSKPLETGLKQTNSGQNNFNILPQGSPPLLLIAEDNEANIATLSSYLSAKGYHISIARNGHQVIEQVQETRPDLILMDIQMPILDGFEATQHIRTKLDLAQLPIIALTALAMPGDRERCLAAGVNEYLSKPVNLKQLLEVIETHLAAGSESKDNQLTSPAI